MPKPETNPYRQTVLIVDDDAGARATLEALLASMDIDLITAVDGEEAIRTANSTLPDLILLDVMMPKMDGFTVCRTLRGNAKTSGIPIVMVTALDDRESRLSGIEAGADDFLTKPIDKLELRARVKTTLRLNRYRREIEHRKRTQETLEGSISIMQDLLSLVDGETFGRSRRLRDMAVQLGRALDYTPSWELSIAAALCQLGQVVVPVEVRQKSAEGDRLNATESRILTRVPKTGSRLLQHIPAFAGVAEIVLWQDKRFDGTGFPFEPRSGTDIPLGARILHLLRAVLELESGGLGRKAALAACEAKSGHFDPHIVQVAIDLFVDDTTDNHLVTLMELKEGMVTRSPIKEQNGRLLVGPGIEITQALVRRLGFIHETRGLLEPFDVHIPKES